MKDHELRKEMRITIQGFFNSANQIMDIQDGEIKELRKQIHALINYLNIELRTEPSKTYYRKRKG